MAYEYEERQVGSIIMYRKGTMKTFRPKRDKDGNIVRVISFKDRGIKNAS